MSDRVNPETEVLSEQITQERAWWRRRGITTIVLCTIGMIVYLWAAVVLWIDKFMLAALILLGAGVFFGYLISTGITRYRWGTAPVMKEEVAQRRQNERGMLFRAAMGQVPTEWRLPSLLTKATLGVLLIGYGLWYILHNEPQVQRGGPEIIAILGLLLCIFTLVEWRQSRQLRTESRALLAERLRSGEESEGDQETNERQED